MSESSNTWIKCYSNKQNKDYYYNNVTGESRWDNPNEDISNNNTSNSSNTNSNTSNNNNDSQHQAKRSKIVEVETASYKPPVSGAAADMAVVKSIILPKPKIISELPSSSEDMWSRKDIQVNDYLASIYATGSIEDSKGVVQKFKDITNPIQGRHLYNLIYENKLTRTCEIGFAMGASAIWICQAHKDNKLNGTHVAIDPNQTSQYENMGRILASRCGVDDKLSVMEMTSYRALPLLLEDVISGKIPKFHLIYIDGWHTFDYTLVDFFYADLLLEVNGIIVLDDIKHKPVTKCLKYIATNYPHYAVVPKTPCYIPGDPSKSSQATFIKLANDTRAWNAHVEF